MNKKTLPLTAFACAMQLPTASAAIIAGSDFSDAAVFNAAGGAYDIALTRPAVRNGNVDLSGAAYQGLTDTTVEFYWYAGGQGSGDIDFDTVVINGDVSPIPEPSSIALLGLASLAAMRRRR